MRTYLFQSKNYLYKKSNVKYLIPVLCIFIMTACSKSKGGGPQTIYDLPPTPPIPPEKYCFEEAGPGKTHIELNVVGDTVTGTVNYGKDHKGDFRGVIYGTTLILNYIVNTGNGSISREQEWKMMNDTLYRSAETLQPDSFLIAKGVAAQFSLPDGLHKVICK